MATERREDKKEAPLNEGECRTLIMEGSLDIK